MEITSVSTGQRIEGLRISDSFFGGDRLGEIYCDSHATAPHYFANVYCECQAGCTGRVTNDSRRSVPVKAVDMVARARANTIRAGKAEYARLSLGYLRLAAEADKKIKTKILDETMPAITQQVRSRRLLHRLLTHVQHTQTATARRGRDSNEQVGPPSNLRSAGLPLLRRAASARLLSAWRGGDGSRRRSATAAWIT
jgi:hypothetical protein